MAVMQVLPNGHLIVTLSPREAALLETEILDPDDFPWQSTESQRVAMEVKMGLRAIVDKLHHGQMQMLIQAIPPPGTADRNQETEDESDSEPEPEQQAEPPPGIVPIQALKPKGKSPIVFTFDEFTFPPSFIPGENPDQEEEEGHQQE